MCVGERGWGGGGGDRILYQPERKNGCTQVLKQRSIYICRYRALKFSLLHIHVGGKNYCIQACMIVVVNDETTCNTWKVPPAKMS